MCQLLETIQVRKNNLLHLDFHNNRVNNSRRYLFKSIDTWDLADLIKLPALNHDTIYKCRFLYSHTVEKIEFLPYIPQQIERLYLVDGNDLEYSFKYADRTELDNLRNRMTNNVVSDILIVRHGYITDTSFANLALFDGEDWITPNPPLLKGTKRAYYLQCGKLKERKVKPADLQNYQKVRLINAMLDLETGYDIDVRNIFP